MYSISPHLRSVNVSKRGLARRVLKDKEQRVKVEESHVGTRYHGFDAVERNKKPHGRSDTDLNMPSPSTYSATL